MRTESTLDILIVDDEPLVRTGLATILRQLESDFNLGDIIEAEDGNKAIKILEDRDFALIFTDIVMPRRDGLSLLDWISDNDRKCQCIVLSCHDDYEYVRGSFKHKILDYILKYDIDKDLITNLLTKVVTRIRKDATSGNDTPEKYWLMSLKATAKPAYGFRAMQIRIDEVRLPSVKVERIIRSLPVINDNDRFSFFSIQRSDTDENTLSILLEDASGSTKGGLEGTVEAFMSLLAREYQTKVTLVHCDESVPFTSLPGILERMGSVMKATFFTGPGIYRIGPKSAVTQYEDISERLTAIKMDFYMAMHDNELSILRKHLDHFASFLRETRITDIQAIRDVFSDLYDLIIEANREVLPDVILEALKERRVRLSTARYLDELLEIINGIISELAQNPIIISGTEGLSTGIRRAILYIHSHYQSGKLSLSDVADALNYSHSHLSRQFKKETGKNLVSYINEVRLKEARKLLSTGKYYIYEVSEIVGFNNYNYFSKLYKQIHGVSPNTDLKIVTP